MQIDTLAYRLKRNPVGLDFSDLITSGAIQTGEAAYDEHDIILTIPFNPEPAADEQRGIIRRLVSENQTEETLRARARGAYAEFVKFEGETAPSNARVVFMVKLLCKVVRALIRLQLRELDSAD